MAGQGPWGGGGNNGNNGKEPPQGGQRPWGSPGGNQGDRDNRGQPQGPRRGDHVPEIEELVRKGQDRLRVLMGGKGGGGRTGGPRQQGPQFHMSRGSWGLAVLAVAAVWAFSSFYTVKPEERSVELLFGKPIGTGEPGLNFAPWPFVTAEVVQVSGERTTEIGTGRAGPMDSGLMLTRDQNIVDMAYQVVWNISDPEKFLFNLADPDDTIRAVAESAMRDIVARSELAPILNRDRGAIADDLKLQVQQTLDGYEAGINILRVNLDRADPPREVIDSFRDVQAAQQERDRLEKEADAYANRVLASARGEAAALIERAEAYRAEAVNTAEGEAARFNSVYNEYIKAPEVTRRRMYMETMEKVLGGANKVILEGQAAQGVVPYLPLDQLRSGAPAAGSAAKSGENQ
ncbi:MULTISPECIES: FtsH protease activity modulator HflK [unclassified Paracoccus (in: a-proteobacteria)]|uniref:FtsH protease activity modulator HflK n=1 Tax=unclassified Paracoccus (in: a-proteobacteria) TaxID=2688777 RepID=UPI0012B33808|nr:MULTISPECIES: FtsH protease activity modulator HflK [unclassified Paracoccus (in: a-proteobacteria)]UXU74229.1 FtsH protease activity modulator HflK [Paracoccus sp. SMMA_5]UXU80120.1 FtsH protease activity modulator HflK [Paracoccus sp. SMMA_5_TC]